MCVCVCVSTTDGERLQGYELRVTRISPSSSDDEDDDCAKQDPMDFRIDEVHVHV